MNESRGGWHVEVSSKGVGVGPVLQEDEAEWILGIAMDGVRQASGFLPRTVYVLEAQFENTFDGVSPGSDASRDDEHVRTLPTRPPAIATIMPDLPVGPAFDSGEGSSRPKSSARGVM
jgi:hypothetical protein